MEKFSETNRGGRPRLLHPKLEAVYREAVGQYTSARTVQNKHYELRALEILGFFDEGADVTPYRWLCSSGAQVGESGRRYYRRTILCELGRFEDDVVLRLYAGLICRLKPKTQEAVRMLRQWRTGKAA